MAMGHKFADPWSGKRQFKRGYDIDPVDAETKEIRRLRDKYNASTNLHDKISFLEYLERYRTQKADRKTATQNVPSVADIRKWVASGNSQSPKNCKILLKEIDRLRAELKKK